MRFFATRERVDKAVRTRAPKCPVDILPSRVFSRDAKRMSQARTISLRHGRSLGSARSDEVSEAWAGGLACDFSTRSFRRRLTLCPHDRPQEAMVCPTEIA